VKPGIPAIILEFIPAFVTTALALLIALLPDRTMVEPGEARALGMALAALAWVLCALRQLFSKLAHENTAAPFAVAIFRICCKVGAWLMAMVASIIALVALKNLLL
jgi:uncharacterized membrane protein